MWLLFPLRRMSRVARGRAATQTPLINTLTTPAIIAATANETEKPHLHQQPQRASQSKSLPRELSSPLSPKTSLPQRENLSRARDCWCGLLVMPLIGLLGRWRVDGGGRGVLAQVVLVVVTLGVGVRRIFRIRLLLVFRLRLLGVGVAKGRDPRGGRIGVAVLVVVVAEEMGSGGNELNGMMRRRVERASRRFGTMAKSKTRSNARTGVVGGKPAGGGTRIGIGGLLRRRRSLLSLGRFSRRSSE